MNMVAGLPRRATNLRKVEMNAAVVRSDTSSKCTAFTEKHTNTYTYALVITGLRIDPDLISIGSGGF